MQYDHKCSGLDKATDAVLAAHNSNHNVEVHLVNRTNPDAKIEEDFDKKLLDHNLKTKYELKQNVDYKLTGNIHYEMVRTVTMNATGRQPLHLCTHAFVRGNKEITEVSRTNELCDIAQNYREITFDSPLNHTSFEEGYSVGHEQEYLEFKKFDDTKNLVKTIQDEMRHYVSAFANTSGGYLYIGIADDGIVSGQDCNRIGDTLTFCNRIEGKIKEMVWIQNGTRLKKEDIHKGKHWDLELIPVKTKRRETDLTLTSDSQQSGRAEASTVGSHPSSSALTVDEEMTCTPASESSPQPVSGAKNEDQESKDQTAAYIAESETGMQSTVTAHPKKKGKKSGKKSKEHLAMQQTTNKDNQSDNKVVVLITIYRLVGGIVFTNEPECPIYSTRKGCVRHMNENEWDEMWLPILYPHHEG